MYDLYVSTTYLTIHFHKNNYKKIYLIYYNYFYFYVDDINKYKC